MPARYREPVVFDEKLVTPDGVALGGHHQITLDRDGTFRHRGHMRATGFPSFTYGVRTVLVNDAGVPAVLAATGRVHGTNEPGDRESQWDERRRQAFVEWHWASMKRARADTAINRDADFFGAFGDVLGFLGALAAGAVVAGTAGLCIIPGVHGAAAAGLDEEAGVGGLVGVGAAAGVLIIFGPTGIVPAIVAGAVAGTAGALLLEHRPMSGRKRHLAGLVFGQTLPVDRIRLTNLLGLGGRPFTIPGVGNAILGAGFSDPIHYNGFGDPDNPRTRGPDQLFIHELVHAWQIDARRSCPGSYVTRSPLSPRHSEGICQCTAILTQDRTSRSPIRNNKPKSSTIGLRARDMRTGRTSQRSRVRTSGTFATTSCRRFPEPNCR
jgi:hypothetical protein